MKDRLVAIILLAAALSLAGFVAEAESLAGFVAEAEESAVEDWPQIRGPHRDGRSQATGLLRDWPAEGPRLVWRRSIGEAFSGISLANGRLFTMASDAENEFVLSLDPETGEELWRHPFGKVFQSEFGGGPRSTPTVDGETVYAVSSYGSLAALAANDGQTRWQLDLEAAFAAEVPRFGYSLSVLVDGDLLLIEAGGKDGKSLVALDKATGDLRFSALDGPASYSSPIIADLGGIRQILFVRRADPGVVALLPNGEVYWTHEGLRTVITMPLFVSPDRVFLSAGHDATGIMLRFQLVDGQPQVEEVWRTPRMKNHFNTSIVVDDHLYGFDNATLKCLDAANGEQRWAHRGFGKGSLIAADGLLIILGDDGQVALAEISPEAYREHSRFQALTGKAWTPPTLAQNRLYLRDQDEIACFDLTPVTTAAVSEGAP